MPLQMASLCSERWQRRQHRVHLLPRVEARPSAMGLRPFPRVTAQDSRIPGFQGARLISAGHGTAFHFQCLLAWPVTLLVSLGLTRAYSVDAGYK